MNLSLSVTCESVVLRRTVVGGGDCNFQVCYSDNGEDNPNAQYKSRFNQTRYAIKITNESKEIGVKSQMKGAKYRLMVVAECVLLNLCG